MRAAFLLLLISVSACTAFPELDERIDTAARDAPYPQLTNIAPLLTQANAVSSTANGVTPQITGRLAGLNARANALRGGVIEPPIRARMQRGINTSALR